MTAGSNRKGAPLMSFSRTPSGRIVFFVAVSLLLPLEQAHDRFNMTPTEFAEVGKEIVKALQAAEVSQADIDVTVCLYQTSMDDVVSAADGPAVRTPSGQ